MPTGYKKTHNEYIKEVSVVHPNIIVVDKYINSKTPILHQCLIDNYRWLARPSDVITKKCGCPVCSHRAIGPAPEYINSIWSSEYKEYFSQFLTEDQMKQYMPHSNQDVIIICPCCENSKSIVVENLFYHGSGCICNDNISFSNKFVYHILKQLNIDIKTEYVPKWANRYRYDIFIPEYNIIIENHGIQHYEDVSFTSRTLKEEQDNDMQKQTIAILNSIKHYIILDCKVSTQEYIKQAILQSDLPMLLQFKEQDIDWNAAAIFAHTSYVKIVAELFNKGCHVIDITKTTGRGKTSIRRWLTVATELGLCNYQPQQESLLSHTRKIVCVELNIVFSSITEAAKYMDTTPPNIGSCLRGLTQTACGYHWQYITPQND